MLTLTLTFKYFRVISFLFIIPWIFNGFYFSEVHAQGLSGPSLLVTASVPADEKSKITELTFIELPENYLCKALDQLEERSRIQFNCPEKLEDNFIYSRTLEGPNWESVARAFLEDYNTLVIYNEAGEAIQFYIVGSKDQAVPTPNLFISRPISTQNVQPQAIPGLPGSNLNRSQLFALLKTSTFKPFPQHFFNISDYQEILNFAGIKEPEDWMVVEKSRALKKHIQKLLKK